jgi:hypothetical protein
MAECQSRGVEGLARGGTLQQLRLPPLRARDPTTSSSPIDWIPDDRVAQMSQMDPDLMGSTGMQLEPKELGNIKPGHERGIRPGSPTGGANHHPLAVLLVPGDGCLDADLAGVQVSPGQACIGATDSPRRDGGPQTAVGQISLGHDHEARGITVQAMDDAGPSLGTARQGSTPRHQCVDQRVIPMPRRRVNDQARRLVNDGEVLVLVDHGERDGAGLEGARGLMLVKPDGDLLTARKESGSASRLAFHGDELICYQAGRLSARDSELVS